MVEDVTRLVRDSYNTAALARALRIKPLIHSANYNDRQMHVTFCKLVYANN